MELGQKFPRKAAARWRVLSRHDLDLVSGWYSSSLLTRDAAAELAALEPHLALLEALGARVLVFAETTGAIHGERGRAISSRPRLADDDWPRLGRRMTEVAEAVAARGLDLVYHHHMGTVVESAGDRSAEHTSELQSPMRIS